jgi:hypothetical protein
MWMKLVKGCIVLSSPSIICSEQKVSLTNKSHTFRILERSFLDNGEYGQI